MHGLGLGQGGAIETDKAHGEAVTQGYMVEGDEKDLIHTAKPGQRVVEILGEGQAVEGVNME